MRTTQVSGGIVVALVALLAAVAAPPVAGGADAANETVAVHGHWLIEVQNPDGSVADRREFSNALSSGPGAGPIFFTDVLRGMAPGAWSVSLTSGSPPLPCGIFAGGAAGNIRCVVAEPRSAQSGNPVFKTLTFLASAAALVMRGTAVIQFDSTIDQVSTQAFVCPATTTPAACTGTGLSGATFTLRQVTFAILDGVAGRPAAVPVVAGQQVLITVTLSFATAVAPQ